MLQRLNPPLALAITALLALWLAMLLVGGSASGWDSGLASLLYARDRPTLASAAALLTNLGGWIWLTATAVAAALFLVTRGERWRGLLLLLLLVLGGRLLIDGEKLWFARARPDPANQLVAVHSLSFPSGHAANSMITYLGIALILAPLVSRPSYRIALVALALVLSLLTGLSRVMLGVHWPSDVIGGWAFGAAWTLLLLGLAGGNVSQPASLMGSKETMMDDTNDRSRQRAETAQRHNDSDLIEGMEDAPSQGGRSGGTLQRDIATQAEEEHVVDGKTGVTRVRGEDKAEGADLPRFNQE